MKKIGLLLALALAAGGCTYGLPFHYGNYGGGPRTPAPRELVIADPRLSPDGKLVMFAFRYKQYPWKIAIASTDPAETKIHVLQLPPMDDWIQPNWGPDGKHFTVVSYCTHDQCYEGAKGYNIWLATAQPTANLKHITPDAPNARRANPMFGATVDDLYWFLSDATPYADVHMDVSDRYLAHMAGGAETVVFPQPPANGNWRGKHGLDDPADLVIISAHGAGRYDEQGYYFAGMVVGGTCAAARTAIDKIDKFHSALFRASGGAFQLVEPVEIEYVDAPRGDRGYVAMAHHFIKEHTNAVADFRAVEDGRTLWSFRFHSQAYGVSASEDLSTVVFNGERSYIDDRHIWHPRMQDSIFVWRQGLTEPVDLNIPERVKAKAEQEIQAETQGQNPAPNPPPNALNQNNNFAVDNGRPGVQE